MKIKKLLLIGGLSSVLLVTLIVGVAFATENSNPASSTVCGVCRGVGGNAMSAVSDLLNMNADEIVAERQNGQSLADIAENKGIDKDKLVDTISDARKAQLQERVEAGQLTQEQAEKIADGIKQRVQERVDRTSAGCGGGGCSSSYGSGAGACGGGGCGGAQGSI